MTRKQLQILKYIDAYIRRHGCSPTYREIAEGTGRKSAVSVLHLVNRLVERGYIRRESGEQTARSLVVVRLPGSDKCPACGQCIPAASRGDGITAPHDSAFPPAPDCRASRG